MDNPIINANKILLASTDYAVAKAAESVILGETVDDELLAVIEKRRKWRKEINEIEEGTAEMLSNG